MDPDIQIFLALGGYVVLVDAGDNSWMHVFTNVDTMLAYLKRHIEEVEHGFRTAENNTTRN